VIHGPLDRAAKARDSAYDDDRKRKLDELRQRLAECRSEWVLKVAPNARLDEGSKGWHLGGISGAKGESLLIYRNPEHRTHIDYNGKQWKGDDLDLIRCLKGLPRFSLDREICGGSRRIYATAQRREQGEGRRAQDVARHHAGAREHGGTTGPASS
jgi:hypothetical protein